MPPVRLRPPPPPPRWSGEGAVFPEAFLAQTTLAFLCVCLTDREGRAQGLLQGLVSGATPGLSQRPLLPGCTCRAAPCQQTTRVSEWHRSSCHLRRQDPGNRFLIASGVALGQPFAQWPFGAGLLQVWSLDSCWLPEERYRKSLLRT